MSDVLTSRRAAPMATPSSANLNTLARKAPRRGVRRWIPGVAMVRNYRPEWLVKDIAAGLVLTALLVPVGMAYAEAAGLPAICGLYASIVPLIAYAVFGPSRILVLGPDSSLAAIIAVTILPLASGNADRAVALAGMLSILSGLLFVLAGMARLGFVTDLLSKPIRYGYLNGIALTVLAGQLPKVFGFSAGGENLIEETAGFVRGILAQQTNWFALAIGGACLILVLGLKRYLPAVPGVLIAVAAATVAVALFDLGERTGLSVLGPLPRGLPGFRVPAVSLHDIGAMLGGAAAVALVSFADMSVLSRTFALRGGYDVDGNQELIALGAANVAAGLFQGFPITSSASRTPVAEAAGGKTQITGVVGPCASPCCSSLRQRC